VTVALGNFRVPEAEMQLESPSLAFGSPFLSVDKFSIHPCRFTPPSYLRIDGLHRFRRDVWRHSPFARYL